MSQNKVDIVSQSKVNGQENIQSQQKLDLLQQFEAKNDIKDHQNSQIFVNQLQQQIKVNGQQQQSLADIDQQQSQHQQAIQQNQSNLNEPSINNLDGRSQSPQKSRSAMSIDDKLMLKKQLEEQLMNLENDIETMEQDEIKQGKREGSQITYSKSKRQQIQSNASNEDYVKRIKELEKERKTLKQKREERIHSYETALQDQLRREQEEAQLNKYKLKQLQKTQSERGLAEIERRKKEREVKQKEENQKLQEAIKSKPLYVNLVEKFQAQQNQDLEEKKKQLAAIREISKPINFSEIKQHQESYDMKKKTNELSTHRNAKSEWQYEKPSYRSKIYEMYNNELELAKNNDEYKLKNAQQIIERRKLFSKIIQENYQPKKDPKKEQQFKELQDKVHTKPRVIKNNKFEGDSYLRESIENAKRKNRLSQHNYQSESTDQLSSRINQTPTKLQSELSRIQFDEEGQHNLKSELDYPLSSLKKRRQISSHVISSQNLSQISSRNQYGQQRSQDGLQNSNIFLQLQEGLNKKNRQFDTVDEKKKFFDYVQREYRKKLGSRYMETAKYYNPPPQNIEDHIKEEVDKELYNEENAPLQKIQVVKNILKPYEEKAERDTRLLGIQQNDDQVRNNVAETYISSIKAKLALISKIQDDSYQVWKKKSVEPKLTKSESSKRVKRKIKKVQYFNVDQINSIYASGSKQNTPKGSPTSKRYHTSQDQPIEQNKQQANNSMISNQNNQSVNKQSLHNKQYSQQQQGNQSSQKNILPAEIYHIKPNELKITAQQQSQLNRANQQQKFQYPHQNNQNNIKFINQPQTKETQKEYSSIQPINQNQNKSFLDHSYQVDTQREYNSNQSQDIQNIPNLNQNQIQRENQANNQSGNPNPSQNHQNNSNQLNGQRDYLTHQQMLQNVQKNLHILEKNIPSEVTNRNRSGTNQSNKSLKGKQQTQQNLSQNQNQTQQQQQQQQIQQKQKAKADLNLNVENNQNQNKLIDINEFEKQKQQNNQILELNKNIKQVRNPYFSIQIQSVSDLADKNPLTYHIQIVNKTSVIKDLDGLNIDVEPQDLILPEEKENIAYINDTLEVNYDPSKMLKHYANHLQNIYVIIRIIVEKQQEELILGWIAHPLFKENAFNYGQFKDKLFSPPDNVVLPLDKSKYQSLPVSIQFSILDGK